jgi:uncharacterized protein YjbJ (UPF0337 family)
MVRFYQYCQNQYRLNLKKLAVRAACLVLVTVAVWGVAWIPPAMAATVGSEKAAAVMNERAAAELDRVSGPGTSDQLEGAVQKTVGKTKRGISRVTGNSGDSLGGKLNNVADRLEGSADELKGQMKRDIGRAKGAAADAGDEVEDTTKGVVESVKDFFN